MINPRPYQTHAVAAVLDYFEQGGAGHPLIAMPTGTGKSIVIAELIRHVLTTWPESRVVMLTHVKELIQQNLDKLLKIWPSAPVGVYSAGLNSYHTEAPILFCGIQSVWNKAKALASHDRPVELILIDEAHRIPLHQTGTYRKFIADLVLMNPDLRLIGLTATPYRYVPATKTMSGGYQSLIQGEDRLLTDLVYDLSSKNLAGLIHQDYLAALWPLRTDYQVETDDLTVRNGDFAEEALADRMGEDEVISSILDEAIQRARQDRRRHWLVFCASIAQAEAMTDGLRARGVCADLVTGTTPSLDRARRIRDFQTGTLTALVSVETLTTGFDAPITDCLIMARPTLSPILYVQVMGRGMRPTPEKIAIGEDGRKRGCLVLDFCGNVERHGPLDQLRLKAPGPKKPEPMKACPQCEAVIRALLMLCPECGYEFPTDEMEKAKPRATDQAVIAGIMPMAPTRYPVHRVSYARHIGSSGIPTLRVDYFSGLSRIASEWICLEHTGYARRKAEVWWRERTCHGAPDTVEDALQQLPAIQPSAVFVKKRPGQRRYAEIVQVEGL